MDLIKCDRCGVEYGIGDWPFCKGGHTKPLGSVIGDDIPGGVWIRHGICNPDGTPKKYYSKSEIKKAAFENNLTHGFDTPKPNPKIVEQELQAREERNKGGSR